MYKNMEKILSELKIEYISENDKIMFTNEENNYILTKTKDGDVKENIYIVYSEDKYTRFRLRLMDAILRNKEDWIKEEKEMRYINFEQNDDKDYCVLPTQLGNNTKTAGNSIMYESKFTKGKVLGYARVSTTGQRDEGVSLDNQEDKIYSEALKLGEKVRAIYFDEGKSAKSMLGRKGLEKLIEDADKGDIIIFHSISRFMRQLRLFLETVEKIRAKGSIIKFLDYDQIDFNSPTSVFMLQLMASLAELERSTTSKRTKEIMENLKKKGQLKTKPRYGYKYEELENGEKILTPIKEEQDVIKYIKDLVEYFKNPSFGVILKNLKEANIPPPGKSKEWKAENIKRIMIQNNILFSPESNRFEIESGVIKDVSELTYGERRFKRMPFKISHEEFDDEEGDEDDEDD
jgi:DNA invertase Pin-like site-specific DNA recombinase